jgi:anti-sigma factor RsiW
MIHIADNHDALLDYLYEEGDPAERLKIARHLQTCTTCSVAVLEFQTVRGMLSEWKPPASQLGFRVVQDGAIESPAPPRAWWVPSSRLGLWAQAAAAVLLFAAGVAVSQLQINYGDGTLTVRTRPAESTASATRRVSIELPAPESVGSGLSRTSTNIDATPTNPNLVSGVTPTATDTNAADVEQLLQRVRAMIEQSEIRQQRELALRLSQVAREVDTQHQADLLRIQQDFGDQQNLMEYLVRTSGGAK